MDPSRTEELLRSHQDRILAAVAQAETLLDEVPAEAAHPLAKLRWEMLRLLRQYQLFKHGEIFDPTIAAGTVRQAALARDLKARCVEAGERYVEHTRRWSTADITGEWATYRPALIEIGRSIRDHLRRERDAVATLLAGRESTRSGPAPERR